MNQGRGTKMAPARVDEAPWWHVVSKPTWAGDDAGRYSVEWLDALA